MQEPTETELIMNIVL